MESAKKILIIEDEDELRHSIVEILHYEGFEVIDAGTGSKGIELLTHESPDIILCDIVLPDIKGYDILDAFNATPKIRDIPFIFMTALFDREHFRQGMEKGADDYLVKPFSREELLKSISIQSEKAAARKQHNSTNKASLNAQIMSGEKLTQKQSESNQDKISLLIEEAITVLETSNSIQVLLNKIDSELTNSALTKEQIDQLKLIKKQVGTNKESRNELTLFLLKFNHIHPHFIINFKKKHHTLSSNEMFLASATLMGLDTNQIAALMHISEASVRKNRYRLKKKLGLPKEQDIYTYIQTFIKAERESRHAVI